MKKLFALSMALFLTIVMISPVSADTNFEDPELAQSFVVIDEENGIYKVITPGYIVEEVPELKALFGDGKTETRSVSVWGVIGVVTFGCYVIDSISDFDPCRWLIRNIWKGMQVPPPNFPLGQYRVYNKFIPGYIPGCQPMHSGPCNSGRWETTYERIK